MNIILILSILFSVLRQSEAQCNRYQRGSKQADVVERKTVVQFTCT